MRYYKIAGIVLKIVGIDDFSVEKMREYEVAECAYDVCISISDSQNIAKPDDVKEIARQKYRVYATCREGYCTYDEMGNNGLSALIVMDRAISNVSVCARDVSHLGGASLSVRKFNMLAEVFRFVVLVRGGTVFHSSALMYDGHALLFSAPSGTGKSTHTGLWCQYMNGAEVFNDDSPAIMVENGQIFAYGTPWSGKSDLNKNVRLPVKAIVFLERATENSIDALNGKTAFLHLVSQSFKAPFTGLLNDMLDVQEKIFENVKLYKLKCNISKQAVDTVYNEVFKG